MVGSTASAPGRWRWCAFVVAAALSVTALAAQEREPLYACRSSSTNTEVAALGLTLCEAEPTPALTGSDPGTNLQLRDGALVTALVADGVAAVAGLKTGDVMYRIGGDDVANAAAAAGALGLVESDADTVVNFLRGGRPYRVKLRRD